MVPVPTREGEFHLPDALVQAVIEHAERQADLTGSYLQTSGLCQAGKISVPPNALLELAAVLELGMWEKQGLLEHLNVDLPTYSDAADRLATRCTEGPQAFEGPEALTFSRTILQVWTQHFAWDGPALLQTDVIVGDVDDEEEFIELLASFVLRHRHELSNLFGKEVSE